MHRSLFLLALIVVAVGCGKGDMAPPAESDPAQAKQALTQALDAWRAGSKPESLRQASPSVIVSDEEWAGGAQLTSYQIQGEGKKFGPSIRINATLEVRGANGQAERKTALYQIATNPVITVNRSDAAEATAAPTAKGRKERE